MGFFSFVFVIKVCIYDNCLGDFIRVMHSFVYGTLRNGDMITFSSAKVSIHFKTAARVPCLVSKVPPRIPKYELLRNIAFFMSGTSIIGICAQTGIDKERILLWFPSSYQG